MPSSTSSFDTDIDSKNPQANRRAWLLTWIIAVAQVLAVLFSYEHFLKQKGYLPSVDDNQRLWSWYRRQASGGDKKLVLIGASRNQLNINMAWLKDKFPEHNVLQLSINAAYPMATLAALADDDDFHGTVIVSLNAQALEDRYLSMQQKHNDYYHKNASIDQPLNAFLAANLASHWRFLHPSLGLEKIIKFYQTHHRWPDPPYTTANLDRSISADYTQTNISRLQQHFYQQKKDNYQTDKPTAADQWSINVERLKNHIQRIEARGGRVVVVRFPTDKGHWQLDQQFYPRAQYWEQLSAEPGITAVHFKDIDGIAMIDLPDSSHLDHRQTEAFTQRLFEHLLKHDLISL